MYGSTETKNFGPLALKAVRQRMVERDWALSTVNKAVSIIKRMFRWGVENELVHSSAYEALRAVAGLRRGRSQARETEPVKPVPEVHVQAVIPHVSPQVAAMIQLQMLTGMRPGEAVIMRGCDIDTTGKIWSYTPASHKTEHHDRKRVIYLGPKARQIVELWLKPDLQAYLFSPKDAELIRNAKRQADRRSPMTPSQARRCRKRRPRVAPGERYTKDSYRRAIQRACNLAFPLPRHLQQAEQETNQQWRRRLTEDQTAEVKAWRKNHRWHPNQLRHNAATFLRKQYGLDAARVILGHSSAAVTEVYAEVDLEKAKRIMGEIG